MCQNCTAYCQADSIFVLGNTIEEPERSLREIFVRAKLNGLTFKLSKLCVAPRKSVLFGWNWEDSLGSPNTHTTSALERVPIPSSVSQLRSYLGSFKQMSDYGSLLKILEKLVGDTGKGKITWTPEAEAAFKASQKAIKDINGVFIPRPDDILVTYSNYSKEYNAIGGCLEIHQAVDGKKKASCRSLWEIVAHDGGPVSCELKAFGCQVTLEFFASYIWDRNNIIEI